MDLKIEIGTALEKRFFTIPRLLANIALLYQKKQKAMFTIDQIKATHAKVKSGADFPKYVSDMKSLGVTAYEHYVSDGHITYQGAEGFIISAVAKWEARQIATHSDTAKLQHALTIHQQGQTDYPTFCLQSAEAGVEKWMVDMVKMTCAYYDKAGNEMVVEIIPAV